MKKITLTLLFLLCFINPLSSQWLNLYNGPSGGADGSNAVTVDAQGNTYVTGYSTGQGTMKDITTLKYNSRGSLVWSRTYNGAANSEDEAYAITVDSYGGIYICGYSTGLTTGRDIIIIKYNNSGSEMWVRTYNGPGSGNDEAYAITIDRDGNPVITGSTYDSDNGMQNTVLKYSPSGDLLWVNDFNAEGGTGKDGAYAITVDTENNIITTGLCEKLVGDSPAGTDMLTMKLSETGTLLWTNIYDAASMDDAACAITIDGNDNIFITGYTTGITGKDYTTIKYDAEGTTEWVSTYNNTSVNEDDVPSQIAIDDDGSIVVTGSSRNNASEDYLTVKYKNSNGSVMFAKRYNDASNNSDIAYSITASNGRYYVAGSSQGSPGAGSEDIVIIEYNKTGMVLAKYRIVNPGTDIPSGIAIDNANNISIAGSITGSGSVDMGAGRFSGEEFDGNGFKDLTVTRIINMSQLSGSEILSGFSLHQNYPNPFNPSTTIRFDVSSISFVKISVFDALGKEISVPVNNYLNAGSYEISVNMSSFSSGLYFYKMTSGSYSDIRKMMLVK